MNPDRENDANSDAVLISVLRFLVARRERRPEAHDDQEPHDGILTLEGLRSVEEVIQQGAAIELSMGATSVARNRANQLYGDRRLVLDRLWHYVETYGIPALRDEAAVRSARSKRAEA